MNDYPMCKCGGGGERGAICPFTQDVCGETEVCECCAECQRECADDI